MLSIDEAIKIENKIAEENQKIIDTQIVFDDVSLSQLYCDDTEVIEEHLSNYRKCVQYHEQLAEWLKLLKWYEQGMEDIPSESGVLPKDVYHAGYSKAIDDFVKEICKMIVQSENNGNYRFYAVEIKQAIADIVEQLKAGGENE